MGVASLYSKYIGSWSAAQHLISTAWKALFCVTVAVGEGSWPSSPQSGNRAKNTCAQLLFPLCSVQDPGPSTFVVGLPTSVA